MRHCLLLFALAAAVSAANLPSATTLRGKLAIHVNGPATVETADHQTITLSADDTISQVLTDSRLNGFEVEARGHFTAPGKFQINPFHTVPLLVRHDGHLKMVTYWCDVCSIRAYTPGPCRCCQKETVLDLRDPDAK
jgi:hypothetical protein